LSSLFLRRIHRERDSCYPGFDTRRGWLREDGCGLCAGRPPVCYEYCCDRIRQAQPSEVHLYVLNVLCCLVSFLGKRSCWGKHLVEITEARDFARLSLAGFQKRLVVVRNALTMIQRFYIGACSPAEALPVFSRILPIPLSVCPAGLDDAPAWHSHQALEQTVAAANPQ